MSESWRRTRQREQGWVLDEKKSVKVARPNLHAGEAVVLDLGDGNRPSWATVVNVLNDGKVKIEFRTPHRPTMIVPGHLLRHKKGKNEAITDATKAQADAPRQADGRRVGASPARSEGRQANGERPGRYG